MAGKEPHQISRRSFLKLAVACAAAAGVAPYLIVQRPVPYRAEIGRIANIDTTGTSNLFDEDALLAVLEDLPRPKPIRFYAPEELINRYPDLLRPPLWQPVRQIPGGMDG
jgi:hypothetical protein